MPEKLPIIAIVGRPNVGKSALFNAILRRRISIVHEQSGVTRDRVAAPTEHFGYHFMLVDTGGLGTLNREKNVDLFDGMIREQVAAIVEEAAAIIWVVNCQEGITPQDEEVGEFLRKTGKPVVLAANKADNQTVAQSAVADFAALGIPDIEPTSCTHSFGVSQLMDVVVKYIPQVDSASENEKRLRVAVVGRPNVGKSSLVNRLFGEDRMMVTDIAGTTRDAVDIPVDLQQDGQVLPLTLIDTAGLRRKKQIDTVVEFFSANRTEQAIRRSDIVLFLIDATDPCTTQERRLGRLIVDANKPCILLANKWDLLYKEGKKPQEMIKLIRSEMPFLDHAPVQIISALNGYNFKSIFAQLLHVREQLKVMVPTSVFNQFLQDTLLRNPPISKDNKRFKIYYGTMVFTPPPKFVLFVNNKKLCPSNYLKFLENQVREAFFPQAGLPINLELRNRERLEDSKPARKAAAGAHFKRQAEASDVNRRIQRSKNRRKV
ncbi:MAG: ribosome biogenesis GTPase Der [Lentisphaerae bacterium]|nr:ribosome biogenesis GTPase Der [Lentisphaerota bacterium]